MGDEANDDSFETTFLIEAAVGRKSDCDDSHVDEGEVEQSHIIENDHAETDKNVLPEVGITFV